MTEPKRAALATTFRDDEVSAVCQLFRSLYAGGDPRQIIRSKPAQRAYAKFMRMHEKGLAPVP